MSGWFGTCFYLPQAIAWANQQREAREKLWAAMPEDEREKAKEEWRKQVEADEAHRRALEIAAASRPRNWIETLFGG